MGGAGGTFTGSLAGGNANGVASTNTFAFDVPFGAPALGVQFTLPSDPGAGILDAVLVSPEGQALAQQTPATDITSGADDATVQA